LLVLDAMGYDTILVETVGVGQEDIEIAALADTTVVVAVPGLGDGIQALKAGLMETGDVYALNKADRDGAPLAQRELELALHLRVGREPSARVVPVIPTVATRGEGAEQLLAAIDAHGAALDASGARAARRAERAWAVFLKLLRDAAAKRVLQAALLSSDAAGVLDGVRALAIDPHSAADALAALMDPGAASHAGDRMP
jgi:LAO/AO transport system kinase